MRALVAAIGSRGDIEPFVLVAEALAARGHEITLALDRGHHTGAAEHAGLTRVELGALGADELRRCVADALAAPPAERAGRALHAYYTRREADLVARMDALAATVDLVIVPEQLLGRPPRWAARTAVVFFVPSHRDDFFALATTPCLRLAALGRAFAPDDPQLRAGWTFTGFWIRRTAGALDATTRAFLAAGAPPVFLTMGSMTGFDPGRLGDAFVAAARACGRRAIVQRGWAGVSPAAGDDVLVVDEVDYATLFPSCAALVVHGGTGTVAHALHAGRPLVILPSVHDQFAWAGSLAALGACAGSLDPFTATPGALTELLARALAPPAKAAAGALAGALRGDPGLPLACDLLEGYVARGPRR